MTRTSAGRQQYKSGYEGGVGVYRGIFTVPRDLNFAVGNVEFVGNVCVHGNVFMYFGVPVLLDDDGIE